MSDTTTIRAHAPARSARRPRLPRLPRRTFRLTLEFDTPPSDDHCYFLFDRLAETLLRHPRDGVRFVRIESASLGFGSGRGPRHREATLAELERRPTTTGGA